MLRTVEIRCKEYDLFAPDLDMLFKEYGDVINTNVCEDCWHYGMTCNNHGRCALEEEAEKISEINAGW